MLEGDRIIAGQDGGGHRDFLARMPIRAGQLLDLWVADHWLPGRYECNFSTHTAAFYTHLFDPCGYRETAIRIDRESMCFRWPPSRASNDLSEQLTRRVQEAQGLRQTLREALCITRRALDGDHEDAGEERAERLRYTLQDIRVLINAEL